MGRNKEIKRLVDEQRKDERSFVTMPLVTGKACDDFLFSETVGSFIRIAVASELSDKELLCFVSKHIIGWSKHHLHTVLDSIGKSHTAIGNHLQSAEKKIGGKLGECKPVRVKTDHLGQKKEMSDEIGEIFSDLSEKPSSWE